MLAQQQLAAEPQGPDAPLVVKQGPEVPQWPEALASEAAVERLAPEHCLVESPGPQSAPLAAHAAAEPDLALIVLWPARK